MSEYRHNITVSPDTRNGERGWWTAAVGKFDHAVDYDGQGRTLEEALCDLIDNLYEALQDVQPKPARQPL